MKSQGKDKQRKPLYPTSERFLFKDEEKRQVLFFTDGFDFFCRLVIDVLALKINQEELTEEKVNQIHDSYLQVYTQQHFKRRGDFTSKHVIQEFKFVAVKGSLSIVQEPYQNNLKSLDYSKLSYVKKLQILKGLALAVRDLSQAGIIHTCINPFWVAILSEKSDTIDLKLILPEIPIVLEGKEQTPISAKSQDKRSIYEAPEVMTGKKLSSGTDIWSIGIVFFELMFGSMGKIQVYRNNVKIIFPEGIPPWMIPFFTKMLDFNPLKRSSPQEILDILNSSMKCIEATEKHFKLEFHGKQKS